MKTTIDRRITKERILANFIECSTPHITYLRGERIINDAVNIDLCTSIRKSKTKWYPDNTGMPSITFEGCGVTWAYNTEQERDAQLAEIVEANS